MASSAAPVQDFFSSLVHSIRWHLRRMPERSVERGLHPRYLGWKWRKRETLDQYLQRRGCGEFKEVVEPAKTCDFPLPRNVTDRESLSRDGALWGYCLYDVPDRRCTESYVAHLRDCTLLFFHTPDKADFFPAIVTRKGTSLECREISYRPPHGQAASEQNVQHFRRATWILERAYHNHSHWLTAHLPKLLMLRDREELTDLLLPQDPTGVMSASLRMLGFDPASFRTFDPARPVQVDELTLVGTDRFDPVHMKAVRRAFAPGGERSAATRKVFISRAKSRGRRLLNEDELWSALSARGFERVLMEELDFAEQVHLLQETRILVAPHGAGLTNMIFCPSGGHVLEIADPGFPNPNFYALASSLGLGYWLLTARASDEVNPLDRDLQVDVGSVEAALERID
jgi:hypothetical protein